VGEALYNSMYVAVVGISILFVFALAAYISIYVLNAWLIAVGVESTLAMNVSALLSTLFWGLTCGYFIGEMGWL
jgi:hypothetical protein